ncbi:MAG: hypothetical protein U0U66_05020 [Cytophagaceae bacterium]
MKNIIFILVLIQTVFSCKETKITTEEEMIEENEQAVIIHFQYGIQGLDSLSQLEERLETVLATDTVGEYDGHEIATDYEDGYLYLYGENADLLFSKIESTLKATSFMKNAEVLLRYGAVDDKEAKEKTFIIE